MRFISNRFFFFSIISICLLWSNIFQSEAQVSAGTLSATVDVDSRSVCQNGTQPIITFTGAGGSAPYTFSYTINGIEQTAVSSASESTVTVNVPTTEAGSFTYTLTKVTDKNNKSQDISSQIVNIIINALPSISGITHICELEQTTTLQSASLPAASLAWQSSDPSIATINDTGQATSKAVGSTNITYIDVNGCAATVKLAVNLNPHVDFTFQNNQCAGAAIPFDSQVNDSGTKTYTYTYKWDFGDGQTSTEKKPSHFFNATGTNTQSFDIQLSVKNDTTGCSVTTSKKTLTLTQSPDATLTSSSPAETSNGLTVFRICASSPSTFSFTNNSSTKSSNNDSYTIDWGDNSTPFTATTWSSTTHTYAVGLWTLKYTIKGKYGCDITKIYNVFVGSNPSVGLVNPGNTSICQSEKISFPINNTENNPLGTIYQFDFGDGTDTTFVHPAPPSISHAYTRTSCGNTTPDGAPNSFYIRIIASNPCGDTRNSTAIQVSTPPVARIALIYPTGCVNRSFPAYSLTNATEITGSSCSTQPKLVWKISSSNYTLNNSTLGSDNGSDDVNQWTPGSQVIYPKFTKNGRYTISLRTGNRCNTSTKDTVICIEPVLAKPTFSLDKSNDCIPLTVNATNTTDISSTCSTPKYSWTVNSYVPGYGGSYPQYSCSDPSAENPTFNFTTPGTYSLSLTIITACGSITSDPQNVIVKQIPSVTINTISDICNHSTITPTINTLTEGTPNTGGLRYHWIFSNGSPGTSDTADPGSISYSTAGTYSVSLSVDNECGTSTTTSQSFTVNPVPTITNSDTDLAQTICSGLTTTPLTLTSDTPNTTYEWTAPANSWVTGYQTSGTDNTIPGQVFYNRYNQPVQITYTITPTTGECIGASVNDVITVNPGPVIDRQPASSGTCVGGTPTTLSFAISNYTGTPTYQWYSNILASNTGGTPITNATTPTYTPSGTTVGIYYYYCKITFEGACGEIPTAVAIVSVYNKLAITAQPTAEQTICVGGQPTLSVTTTGGDGFPSYQWYQNTTSSNSGGQAISGATNATFIPPSATTGTTYYYCEIRTTGNDCNFVISDVAKITVVADPVIITQPVDSQTLCQNSVPTTLQTEATGGIGNTYHYAWYSNTTDDNTSWNDITNASSASYTPSTSTIGATNYHCVITQDGIGCDATTNPATVIVNAQPSISQQPLSATYCLGETASALSVQYTNGAGTSSYQWYRTTTNDNTTGTKIDNATYRTFTPPTDIAEKVYYYCHITLSISDCSQLTSTPASITVKPRPVIANKTKLACSETNFTITPTDNLPDIVPSGTAYTWNSPSIAPSGSITGISVQSTPTSAISQTLTNTTTLPATATYTVTPTANGCSGADFTVAVTVNPAIKVVESITHSSCYGANNGAIQCTISGGVPFVTGPPQNIAWTGPDGFAATTAAISGLKPGDYTITVSDNGGFPFVHTYTIKEPNDIIISTDSKKDITCNGYNNGSIAISVTGGTLPYSYSWTKNGQTYASTQNIESLAPGSYEVTVSDANHCGPKTMTYTITEPTAITSSVVKQTNVLCYGNATGAISVDVTGGTATEITSGIFDYGYSWVGPNGYTNTNKDISNLKAGNYTLTASDQNGCSSSLTVVLTQNPDIVIDAGTTDITCYGTDNGTINLNISGGTAPYQAQWNTFASGTSQTNLSPGTYTIMVTDANSCQKSTSIVLTAPPVFKIDPVVKNVTCHGAHDGSIKLNITGNPISVVWSDGSTSGNERNNIGPGNYTVDISDGSPCVIHRTFIITEPEPLSIAEHITDALDCTNANSGSISLTISGGTMPYLYAWSNNATTKDITNVQAGNYNITVTDANNCTLTSQFEIKRPDPIKVVLNPSYDYDCSAQHLYQAFAANTTGGLPPYAFAWSSGILNSPGTSTKTDQSGLISVTVTDSRGCYTSSSAASSIPEVGISYNLLDCNTRSYMFNALLVNEATENYRFLWNFGDGATATSKSAQHIFPSAGIYTVQLTLTGNSCTTTFSKAVPVEGSPNLAINPPEPKFCKGDSISVFASGATTYKWNNGSTSDHLLLKQDGDYSVQATTNTGCSQTLKFTASYYPSHEYPIRSDKDNISFKNSTIRLWSDDEPALYYLWNFGDRTTAEGLNQTHTYTIDKGGYYDITLSATNPYGCKSVVHKFVFITNDTGLNTFTPNGDGLNDVFLKGWHVKIFNRNGVQLFDGTDGWDGTYHGKMVSPDTYFYIVYYMTESGTKTKEGYVTVIR